MREEEKLVAGADDNDVDEMALPNKRVSCFNTGVVLDSGFRTPDFGRGTSGNMVTEGGRVWVVPVGQRSGFVFHELREWE